MTSVLQPLSGRRVAKRETSAGTAHGSGRFWPELLSLNTNYGSKILGRMGSVQAQLPAARSLRCEPREPVWRGNRAY
jgi:hypothetical protein